uniref:19 kDa protein n=1 Tax=Persimmon virus B TaxID=1493829 RepID=A0A0A8JCD3_9CLOS|nr:19 kDa protein [Persimmon virus B]
MNRLDVDIDGWVRFAYSEENYLYNLPHHLGEDYIKKLSILIQFVEDFAQMLSRSCYLNDHIKSRRYYHDLFELRTILVQLKILVAFKYDWDEATRVIHKICMDNRSTNEETTKQAIVIACMREDLSLKELEHSPMVIGCITHSTLVEYDDLLSVREM